MPVKFVESVFQATRPFRMPGAQCLHPFAFGVFSVFLLSFLKIIIVRESVAVSLLVLTKFRRPLLKGVEIHSGIFVFENQERVEFSHIFLLLYLIFY